MPKETLVQKALLDKQSLARNWNSASEREGTKKIFVRVYHHKVKTNDGQNLDNAFIIHRHPFFCDHGFYSFQSVQYIRARFCFLFLLRMWTSASPVTDVAKDPSNGQGQGTGQGLERPPHWNAECRPTREA